MLKVSKQKRIIYKLGGSVITDKNKKEVARRGVIESILKIVQDSAVAIVHGGGGFGHYVAHEVGLNLRPVTVEDARKVMESMDKLSTIVYNVARSVWPNVILIKPRDFIINKNLKIYDAYLDILATYYELGSIILTHGDVVPDLGEYRFSVCSGDVLVVLLSIIINPDAVVFLSDVDGLFTADPKKNPNAELIKDVKASELYGKFEESSSKDVTGGMRLKVDTIRDLARISDVYVLNGLNFENLRKFVRGENFVGTRIRKG